MMKPHLNLHLLRSSGVLSQVYTDTSWTARFRRLLSRVIARVARVVLR